MLLIQGFHLRSLLGTTQKHANNEWLKSTRNKNKNEIFYAYENVMRL